MALYLHFIAFDFLYVTEFLCGRINAVHPVPKRCKTVQHTLDTQHVFLASFHYDNRL